MTHTEEKFTYADDFLGRLAQDWEAEAHKAEALGVRTVIMRLGVVLGPGGGALAKMFTPFKLGLGGVVGDGRQAFSWIHIEDLCGACRAFIEDASYSGVYNMVSPGPTTNAKLTEALAEALHRPAAIKVPALALKLQFGEGAGVLIKGQKVLPKRLVESGFDFRFREIGEAVRDCVRRSKGQAPQAL